MGRAAKTWEEVGQELEVSPACSLWRRYCDQLSRQWIARELNGRRFGALLKTDAYDEAVGEGVYPFLEKLAARVYAVDISRSTCHRAAQRCRRMATIACDVRRLPLSGESLDLVISLSTLDHFGSVADIREALRCLYRVLRPGGRLLITLDNLSNPFVRLRNSLPWRLLKKSGLVPYPVGATLHAEQLRRLLGETGFEVHRLTTLMHIPRAPAVGLAALLDKTAGSAIDPLVSGLYLGFEALGKLPTARWTGNYIAAAAVKPSDSNGSSTLFS